MNDPKALALFQEILKKTRAGKLEWQPTAEEDKFVAPMLGKYTWTLVPYTSRNNYGEPEGAPSVALEDEKKNSIVEINTGVDGVDAEELRTLLVFARRFALKADEVIDELLQELQKPELSIISARYGADEGWRDVAPRLRAKIRDDRLIIGVTNEELGGDPAPGVPKRLELTYSYGGRNYSKIVRETDALSIP
jgi:Domain of unknown function (DUF3395)